MIEVALIGAGERGMHAYASYALEHPHEVKFIAVAEPIEERRALFSALHAIPPERQFRSWEELLQQGKLCEALLICTQDRLHYEVVMEAIRLGYRILLEKPMSPSPRETLAIADAAEQAGASITVCHVMRYSSFYTELKRILDSGAIGSIVTIQWTENVGYWHQAHSFVRGNWRNKQESSPMILQKCCHDMDMLQWLVGSECVKVSSDGSLAYFRKENAPEGATARCADGCQVEHDCPYSAFKWYYNTSNEFPAKVATLRPDLDDRMQAIKEGPYGRCVYHCDNDVVDHQVATLLFDNGVTVAFTMTGLTLENKRTFAIMGTLGEIVGDDRRNELEVRMFAGKSERIVPAAAKGGHQGADSGIMRDFVRMGGAEGWEVANGKGSGMAARNKTSADVSARSHLIAFALEHSRVTGQAVNMRDYVEQIRTGALDETKM